MRNIFKNTEQKRRDFEALAFPVMDRLYITAFAMTKDPIDAEDLVQETYFKAYRCFHSFKLGTNFYAWAYRILTNTFINGYRKQKSKPPRVNFEAICENISQEDGGEFDVTQEELFDDSITAALDELPEMYRTVVLLCDVNELKYKEIAEILNCPIGTVMSRLSRARKKLAKSLHGYAQANGYVDRSN
ncbi:sigma-70 family RNA polymerase sigma factor [candidate division KSB1 bacterium]|nr:sigma-70 family RNA polymerase sigma factor [candidate division KSB1 bacterium]NIR70771.1 sigma-70 family RNA polymerase sigma factor [candidate division KSB1 bacterium]NIS23225.1 sigma-70 family RNA polymerase sigma factor [candidate division KSB1 bacterium]NIT70085.1 sigma-70 family RNA polymerase sigma factor [candidate division KSB1 bacterium]NIU23721.1 sigma-70 family RNA polymerase sigma factor [candidate division KSB1 bacterium]